MKIKMWVRTTSPEDTSPTLRIDAQYENRDTPVVQRYGRKLLKAIGWNETNPNEPFVVIESNGEIINVLTALADKFDLKAAAKFVHDGDVSQVLLDAAKIVEAWTVEHGEYRRTDAAAQDGGAV